ncbi:hypothetical protein JCGZ_01174 [Jatropha curcas]|uniref:Aminotransferase-like plant mobile domain-containing protein n=1 Tax=Jatropha curcas TaxID=180498 RepID=A0A067JGM1_JATCU|nr:hypothetical protein JCGZ_01174 [Jatropha curcas]
MSQLYEIPASTYTLEMETLGALLDIPTFDGEPVPVSRNPLTLGTRPLQLLPLPGMEFPVQYKTSRMRGFQAESVHALAVVRRWKELRDAAVLSEQLRDATLRDAAVEMCGAAVEMRGASVLRMPNFEQLRDAAGEWRDAGTEVNLGKACSGGSSTDASVFWDLLGLPMRARVIAAGFGDYAAGLRHTQPRFPPAMRYALMERWNDCTHTFEFGFGEMTLTPVDYVSITGLRFTGPVAPLDARYQTTTLGAQLVCSLLSVTTQTRDLSQVGSFDWATLALAHLYHDLDVWTRGSGESTWQCIRPLELLLTPWDCEAWRTYPGREVAELHTPSRLLMRGYWVDRYYLGERVYDTPMAPAQRRVPHAPPRHMCLLEGMTLEDLEERKTHRTAAHYRAEAVAEAGAAVAPAGPAGVVLGDVPFPPGIEVVLDPDLGLGSGITIPADLMRAPPPPQLDPEHATHVPAWRYLEICQGFGFARTYIAQLYSERHERDLEIGRLRRHQSLQSSAVRRLQAEVDRLWTRLEVESIPLDSSEEDDGGSSSDDAPPSPSPQAAAGPSRRRQ